MIADILRSLLAPAPARLPEPDARLALAALLVRVAKTDGLYSAEEVEHIDRVLMAHHRIGPFEVAKLRAEAEELEAIAPDTVRFTRALKAATALEDRAALMEALRRGEVAAVSLMEPWISVAQKEGLRILIESHSTRAEAAGDELDAAELFAEVFAGFATDVFAAKNKAIKPKTAIADGAAVSRTPDAFSMA